MNIDELLQTLPRYASDLNRQLDEDPLAESLLRPLATDCLLAWVESDAFKVRANWELIKKYAFAGQGDDCDRLIGAVRTLWSRYGWVHYEYTTPGWKSGDQHAESTKRTYRSMANSNLPWVRERGYELLWGNHSQRSYEMATVSFEPLIATYIANESLPTWVLGTSRESAALQSGLPLRLVKEIFNYLKRTGRCREKVKKISGTATRVLVEVEV